MSDSFPYLVDLAPLSDPRGSLVFIQNGVSVDFIPKRIYYLYGAPAADVVRGLHAHRELKQLIIAVAGSFQVKASSGQLEKTFRLSSADKGLYFPAGIWRELTNFSEDAVCLVLASEEYDKDDYIFDFDEFLDFKSSRRC